MAIHHADQKQLPILVVGAGLPSLVKLSAETRSYAERLFEYPDVGALDDEGCRRALVEPAVREGVAFDDAVIAAVTGITSGYPYFLQEWGYQLWMMAERSPITLTDFAAAQKIVVERLDRGFFRSRLERLTEPEKKHLQAMACLGHGPWTEQTIAPDEAGSSRSFSVTHPFHPLNGRRFEAVDIRLCLGEERVYFVGEDGRLQRRLVRSTSLEAPDPFVEMSAGRSAFRVRDLLALSDLVASLSGSGS